MQKIKLIATTSFGLEKIVRQEVEALGFTGIKVTDGNVTFTASPEEIPKANIWLRSADRVLLQLGEFKALDFGQLFDQTKALPWDQWITKNGKMTVKGRSGRSVLRSVRSCQSIVKKAVVEKLKEKKRVKWIEETGPEFTIHIVMYKDIARLSLDTSGEGLHKRGYRLEAEGGALRETIAAALVQLTDWNKGRLLLDPMCGSGTILIEAAMLARNMAPGLNRTFAAESWPAIEAKAWTLARKDALQAVYNPPKGLQIFGYDIDAKKIKGCRDNARKAGVVKDIIFQQKDFADLGIDQDYGILLTNAPYGVKVGNEETLEHVYAAFNKAFGERPRWSLHVLTADMKFTASFIRGRADKIRKLFNGPIEVCFYQYFNGGRVSY